MAKMFKKIFAMMMVMCMLVGMLPMQALAEESIPAPVEGLDVTVTVDEENNTVVVEIVPAEETAEEPVEETSETALDWESELTFGEKIEVEVTDVEITEEVTEEGETVVTESVTVETQGTIEENVTVEGEETYTETTTTTEDSVTVESVVEGTETIVEENGEITPEDEDLPEVEVPAFTGDQIFAEGTKEVVVETVDPEEVVVSETREDGKVHTTITDSCTTTTTTTENVTVVEQEKVEEEDKTVETTTTTTIDKVTTETVVDELYQYGVGNNLLDQNITQDKTTEIIVNTTVNVTEVTTEITGDKMEGEDDTEYDYTEIETTIEREVNTELEVSVEDESSFDMDAVVAPEDYEGKHYDNGLPALDGNHRHFEGLLEGTDPDNKAPGEKPEEEGYDYVLSGSGDATYAAAPVFKNIVYLRDENGNPIPDPENPGSYLIDEEKSTLVYAGSKAGNSGMNGTPSMIVVKNEEGELFYTYCIDKVTPTDNGSWYKITNLEDSDYYPDDESAAMLRAIVTNGYWGTDANVYEVDENGNVLVDEEGKKIVKKDENGNIVVDETVQGSLAKIKAMMREAYDEDDTVTVKDAKGVEHTYNIVDLIDELKEHEALAVTQSAIWSYSNGALATMNGQDGVAVVGVMSAVKYYNSNGASPLNQYGQAYNLESDARLQALYDLFMNLEPMVSDPEETTTVINESNFVEEMHITIGDKAEHEDNYDEDDTNDVYESELNFTLAFVPDPETDDLLVYLLDAEGNKITDKNGKPIIKRLAGENGEGEDHETITPDANGVYTLKGLQLSENSDFKFDLKLEGTQLLKEGVYVYTSHGGRTHSQTLVGLAKGTQNVEVSASMTISFNVDESKNVVATRHWRSESDPRTEEVPQDPPRNYRYTPGTNTTIEEEPVPLAEVPQTGDNSVLWFAMILLSGLGLCVIEMSNKKCKA